MDIPIIIRNICINNKSSTIPKRRKKSTNSNSRNNNATRTTKRSNIINNIPKRNNNTKHTNRRDNNNTSKLSSNNRIKMDEKLKEILSDATKENWTEVDKKITTLNITPEHIKWAYEALSDTNKHVRDLGASIIEKAEITEKEFTEIREKLYQRLTLDINPNVRYRSAFALAAHGTGKYKSEVLAILNIARYDNEIKETAEKYIKQLEE